MYHFWENSKAMNDATAAGVVGQVVTEIAFIECRSRCYRFWQHDSYVFSLVWRSVFFY